jgi:hypothetical protein
MFDANGGRGGIDDAVAEDTRLYGYDPMIPPALIQEELPAVSPLESVDSESFCGSWLALDFWLGVSDADFRGSLPNQRKQSSQHVKQSKTSSPKKTTDSSSWSVHARFTTQKQLWNTHKD